MIQLCLTVRSLAISRTTNQFEDALISRRARCRTFHLDPAAPSWLGVGSARPRFLALERRSCSYALSHPIISGLKVAKRAVSESCPTRRFDRGWGSEGMAFQWHITYGVGVGAGVRRSGRCPTLVDAQHAAQKALDEQRAADPKGGPYTASIMGPRLSEMKYLPRFRADGSLKHYLWVRS